MSFYAPRLATFAYRGVRRYSLTICVLHRRPEFSSEETVGVVRTQLSESASRTGFDVPVYCFMPDHLHLLAIAREDADPLGEFVRRFKQMSEFAHRRNCGRRLWQRSFWDRVLREEEPTFVVARYILANPSRAGLVDDPRAYPFSGSFSIDREELFRTAFEART